MSYKVYEKNRIESIRLCLKFLKRFEENGTKALFVKSQLFRPEAFHSKLKKKKVERPFIPFFKNSKNVDSLKSYKGYLKFSDEKA